MLRLVYMNTNSNEVLSGALRSKNYSCLQQSWRSIHGLGKGIFKHEMLFFSMGCLCEQMQLVYREVLKALHMLLCENSLTQPQSSSLLCHHSLAAAVKITHRL